MEQALEDVRPYLQSHGGNVELLDISAGRIRLRMSGSCYGCPSPAATLRDTIEKAICRFAPDATGIEVEGISEERVPANLVTSEVPQTNGVAVR